MTISITLTGDLRWWDRQTPRIERSLRRAGSDALRAMRKTGSDAVRAKKKFKLKQVQSAFQLSFPSEGTKIEDLEWRLTVRSIPTPLGAFPARQTRKGVKVTVNTGSPKLFPGAFIATMKSGHRGVFYRLGKQRLPIDEAFSTRVSDVFQDAAVIPEIMRVARSAFHRTFVRNSER